MGLVFLRGRESFAARQVMACLCGGKGSRWRTKGRLRRRPIIPDANCDHARNVGDAVYVVNYIFRGGPAPKVGCAVK